MKIHPVVKKGKQTGKWFCLFYDHIGVRRKLTLFSDKRASQVFADNLERLIECRASGEAPAGSLKKWVEGLPPRFMKRFQQVRLLTAKNGKRPKSC